MLYEVQDLPESPLEAAGAFYAGHLPILEVGLTCAEDGLLTILFPPADHTHRAWRLAAVQELARKAAPRRVNALASDNAAAIAAALRYLKDAAGVTGQYLPLDDAGAGIVIEAKP